MPVRFWRMWSSSSGVDKTVVVKFTTLLLSFSFVIVAGDDGVVHCFVLYSMMMMG